MSQPRGKRRDFRIFQILTAVTEEGVSADQWHIGKEGPVEARSFVGMGIYSFLPKQRTVCKWRILIRNVPMEKD